MRIVAENPKAALAEWMTKAMAVGFLLWLALTGLYLGTRQNKTVWRGQVEAEGITVNDVVLDSMEPNGTLKMEVTAKGLTNGWVGVHCVLVNPTTEKASYLYRELGYWSGSGWSEGKRRASKTVTQVPNGKYMLQVQIEEKSKFKGPVQVKLIRDVTLWRYPVCTFFLVFLVPLLVIMSANSGGGGGGGSCGGSCNGGGCGGGGGVIVAGGGGGCGGGGADGQYTDHDGDGYDDY